MSDDALHGQTGAQKKALCLVQDSSFNNKCVNICNNLTNEHMDLHQIMHCFIFCRLYCLHSTVLTSGPSKALIALCRR